MHRCRSQQAHTGGWSIPAALTTALLSVAVTALALPALWPASSLAEVASCCQPDPAMAARLPPHPSRRRQPQPSPAWRLRLSATLLALPTAQEAAALAAGHAAVGAEGALLRNGRRCCQVCPAGLRSDTAMPDASGSARWVGKESGRRKPMHSDTVECGGHPGPLCRIVHQRSIDQIARSPC